MAVTGTVEKAPNAKFFSAYFLRDPMKGSLMAGLRDPQGMLLMANGPVTLQVEKLPFPEVNGMPILKVISVSPQFFAQPSAWTWEQRGPAAFSRFGMDAQPKDFAGTPFSDRRAYATDNGLESRRFDLPSATETPAPLRLMNLSLGARAITGEFVAQAGLTYEVQFVNTLGEVPETVTILTPGVSGEMLFSAARNGSPTGFFLIRAVEPSSL